MKIRVALGQKENGIVIGNLYDKYGSKNPLIRWMMLRFESHLSSLVTVAAPETIFEVGCGEGYWVLKLKEQGFKVCGCDFAKNVIEIARENAKKGGWPSDIFSVENIYDLKPTGNNADLVICCEVLEHLEDPDAGLRALKRITGQYLIVSVPREPLWSALNLSRGKYIVRRGNTPGHIQQWSKSEFIKLVSEYFEVVEIRNPLPWTMLLCVPN
jgi:2-polyprenyl-3-methyl-5-hydroxy-6-metoxy-1,4-benzoquinol methylase